MLRWHSGVHPTFIDVHSRLHATQIVVEYDGVIGGGGKSVEKLSKSRRIIKSWKTSRVWKVKKVIGLKKLGYQPTLALSGAEVIRVADYLQTNAFPNLVVVEREEYPHALQRKATRGATSKVVRETAGRTRPGLTLGTSTSASTIHPTPWWVRMTEEQLPISRLYF